MDDKDYVAAWSHTITSLFVICGLYSFAAFCPYDPVTLLVSMTGMGYVSSRYIKLVSPIKPPTGFAILCISATQLALIFCANVLMSMAHIDGMTKYNAVRGYMIVLLGMDMLILNCLDLVVQRMKETQPKTDNKT